MSIKVMSWIWENGPSNGTERMVLLALADHCDDQGHAYPSMARLAAKACVTERGARQIMRRLEAGGWVMTQVGGGRGGKSRYQILMESPEQQTRYYKPGMTNPETDDAKPGTTLQETRNHGSAEPSVTVIEPSRREDEGFEAFYAAYPRKVGKDSARKAWAKAAARADPADILAALPDFAASVHGTEMRFIPHASTWLNQGRWQDDQSHARTGPRTSTEDLRSLATISVPDDLAALITPTLKVIGS